MSKNRHHLTNWSKKTVCRRSQTTCGGDVETSVHSGAPAHTTPICSLSQDLLSQRSACRFISWRPRNGLPPPRQRRLVGHKKQTKNARENLSLFEHSQTPFIFVDSFSTFCTKTRKHFFLCCCLKKRRNVPGDGGSRVGGVMTHTDPRLN